MARKLSFKKPNMATVWTEVIMLVIWLFFGDKVISVLNGLVGESLTYNFTGQTANTTQSGCTDNSIFKDAYEFLGVGYDCSSVQAGYSATTVGAVANSSTGLLGIVALVMVVTILMNFISYN